MQLSVAKCNPAPGFMGVFYRHSRTGETINIKEGESLPRRKGQGGWYALAGDNVMEGLKQPILMGTGLMWISEGAPVETGDEINVLCTINDDLRGGKPREGRYRVTAVCPQKWMNRDGIHIQIEHVGDMDPTKVVYLAGLANC